jgi:hypothetical protein
MVCTLPFLRTSKGVCTGMSSWADTVLHPRRHHGWPSLRAAIKCPSRSSTQASAATRRWRTACWTVLPQMATIRMRGSFPVPKVANTHGSFPLSEGRHSSSGDAETVKSKQHVYSIALVRRLPVHFSCIGGVSIVLLICDRLYCADHAAQGLRPSRAPASACRLTTLLPSPLRSFFTAAVSRTFCCTAHRK